MQEKPQTEIKQDADSTIIRPKKKEEFKAPVQFKAAPAQAKPAAVAPFKAPAPAPAPVKVEAKPLPKTPETKKVELKKEEKKELKAEAKKPAAKKAEKPKKVFIEISEKVKARKALKQGRLRVPTIRGRFGKKCVRRVSQEKWQKWRKPRGQDVLKTREDGAWPKTGFGALREIKGVHPSGFTEVLVCNVHDLIKVKKAEQAARIGGTVGGKKRKEIIARADVLGLKVLNR